MGGNCGKIMMILICLCASFARASEFVALTCDVEDNQCAICLSPLSEIAIAFFPCSNRHAFHRDCIRTWLQSSRSCPLCRERLLPRNNPSNGRDVEINNASTCSRLCRALESALRSQDLGMLFSLYMMLLVILSSQFMLVMLLLLIDMVIGMIPSVPAPSTITTS